MVSVLQALVPILVSGGITGAVEPQLAAAGDRFAVCFGSGSSIYVAQEKEQRTWSTPRKVADVAGLALGMRRGPRLATAGQTWVLTAHASRRMKGDLIAFRSTDGGTTWTGPDRINDVEGSAAEGLGALCAWKGRFVAVWLDARANAAELYLATLDSKSGEWSRNVRIYRSPSGNVCECCHPTVAAGRDGRLYVMFRNSVNGSRDMYALATTDGVSFEPARKLGSGTWPLEACPMDGGMLAFPPGGSGVSIWRREGSIFSADLGATSEVKLGDGEQPWVAADASGWWAVWLRRRKGDLVALRNGAREPIMIAQSANDPVALGTGNRVLAAWSDVQGVEVVELPKP